MSNTLFEKNPSLKEYHETSDGQCFYQPQDARNHARSLKDKTVNTVTRNQAKQNTEDKQDKPVKISAKDAIEAIGNAATAEDLKAFEADERTTVKEAYEKRIKELAEAGSDNQKPE